MTYTIELEPLAEGGYSVAVPALPGCITWGSTYQEAVAMAQEAVEGFIEALSRLGQPIPVEDQPRGRGKVKLVVSAPAMA